MRKAFGFNPRTVVKSDRIDTQRVTFPLSDRVARIRRFQILRMRAPIHINDPKAGRSADVKDKHALQLERFHDLETISGPNLPRAGRWFASGMWRIPFEIGLTVLV